ncbi:hypothetical protein [Aquipuribacter nitratireducens]|uniref:Uncharacterized protein n=1 Tax=Aquipuribacter nitratireducens TaxID=650104 RepID=A0ABW0GVE6_9MICO
MRDRIATVGPIAAVGAALGLCCGLPILLSLGVLGAITGLSLQSWALVGLGVGLTAFGWVRIVRADGSTGPALSRERASPWLRRR